MLSLDAILHKHEVMDELIHYFMKIMHDFRYLYYKVLPNKVKQRKKSKIKL